MERIKNLKDVILNEGELLVELVHNERKSGIVLEKNLKDEKTNDYGIIVAKGSAVIDLDIGDIVVRTRSETASGYKCKDKEYLLFSRYNASVVVKPANFDLTDELRA